MKEKPKKARHSRAPTLDDNMFAAWAATAVKKMTCREIQVESPVLIFSSSFFSKRLFKVVCCSEIPRATSLNERYRMPVRLAN
jgi:hypothetical protein